MELQVLIGLKRLKYERVLHDYARERMRTADQRWADIEAEMRQLNFNKKAPIIRNKWEKLMTNFKKVFAYQRNIPLGNVGNYEMGSNSRKEFHLPTNFDHKNYNAMECWVPNHCAVFPRPGQIVGI